MAKLLGKNLPRNTKNAISWQKNGLNFCHETMILPAKRSTSETIYQRSGLPVKRSTSEAIYQ
jgi:hypothetical protein